MSFINNALSFFHNNDHSALLDLLYKHLDLFSSKFSSFLSLLSKDNFIFFLIPHTHLNIKHISSLHLSDDLSLFLYLRFFVLHLINFFKHSQLDNSEFSSSSIDSHLKSFYFITIADNNSLHQLFILYLLIFDIESFARSSFLHSSFSHSFVGIDFEFAQRKIALMQLCFNSLPDDHITSFNFIWLINPALLSSSQSSILVSHLMTNPRISKIFHGPDSLDIPYMFNELFQGNRSKIIDFTHTLYDTRFLCEYYRLSLDLDKNCSIYNALEFFNTISSDKKKSLETIHDNMGPVQDISWNIFKLSSFHIQYALYDVLFLDRFLHNIFAFISSNTPHLSHTYSFIHELIRFAFLERREVTNIVDFCKSLVNPLNNYIIRHNNSNITLVSIFNSLISNFTISTPHGDIFIDHLLSIGYIKKTFIFVLKFIVFSILLINFDVYVNKNNLYRESFDLSHLSSLLSEFKFFKLSSLVSLFHSSARQQIFSLYK